MTTVKTKNSTTGGNVPSSLAVGELAVNLVDKRLFSANSTQIFDAIQNTTVSFAITNNSSAALRIGNSTVNCVANSSSVTLSNSTVTFTISRPTAADVTAGKVLAANGLWITPAGGGGSPGGSNTYIQFNDSSSFGGDANLTFDKVTETLAAVNETLSGNLTANSDYISIGNSTINTVINSVSFVTGNSTVTSTVNSTALMFGASSIGGTNNSNGYSVMPNGLIFQWGFGVATTSPGTTFTFPLAFPTAIFAVQITSQGKQLANDAFINAVSTSSFNAITSTTSTNCYYFAIGK